ncbi:hypothetical protein FACS189488_12760 [Betaproteobacteria bacterium]|nr:hypothetical protein FACS189488_12760 [Betaproteobacteria bacterium]
MPVANHNTLPEVLLLLANDPDGEVREAVAENPSTANRCAASWPRSGSSTGRTAGA